jgi:hypothetical protein
VATYRQLGWVADDIAAIPTSSRQVVTVDLSVDGARVRLPATMTPALKIGDRDGWYALTDLSVSETAISGRFRLNIVNRPTVSIDRITGDIDIRGSGGLSFQGQCAKAAAEAKF